MYGSRYTIKLHNRGCWNKGKIEASARVLKGIEEIFTPVLYKENELEVIDFIPKTKPYIEISCSIDNWYPMFSKIECKTSDILKVAFRNLKSDDSYGSFCVLLV